MKTIARADCAILPLVLKGEWYDMIDDGRKLEEYRDATPYWATRLHKWDNTDASAHVVEFRRGYGRDAPRMAFACRAYASAAVARHLEWGEPITPHYILFLGERVKLHKPGEQP